MGGILFLVLYPIVLAFFMPLAIFRCLCNGNGEINNTCEYIFFGLISVIFYPIWLVLAIIPGYCYAPKIIEYVIWQCVG